MSSYDPGLAHNGEEEHIASSYFPVQATDFDEYIASDSCPSDYELEGTQRERKSKSVTRTKHWPTPLAVLIIKRCADYCMSTNKDRFDVDDTDIDWERWYCMLEWPGNPQPLNTCIKKIKEMQKQWKSPRGSLAKPIRQELMKEPLVFGPGASTTTTTTTIPDDGPVKSRKRSSPPINEIEQDQQTTAKRPKLSEIVEMIQSLAQSTSGELQAAQQRLGGLRQRLESIYAEIREAEEDVQLKMAEQNKFNAILQAACAPLPPSSSTNAS